MVAPGGAMSDSESCSSSNSDAEELARCREAAMPAWGLEQRPRGAERPRAGLLPAAWKTPDAAGKQVPASQPSLRREVNQHEEDANELQTTPEFRAHVAKKLGAMLDSSIAISEVWKKPRKAEVQQVAEEEDGFRLFFTSIPGGHEKEASQKPCRRKRQPPSSSSEDSDEERQRCREAAVSAWDILQESAIHCPAEVEREVEKKKKQKKKARKEADVDLARATGLKPVKEAGSVNGDPASLGTKKKKRKKKAKKSREASPCPPAERAEN